MNPVRSTGRARGTTRDAAGRRVTLFDPGIDWLVGNRDRIDEATADRVMRELNGEVRASRRVILGGIAFVGLLAAAALIALGIDIAIEGRAALRDALGSLVLTGPAVTMMLVAGVVVPVVVARRRRLARTHEIMLRNGHCPHCGYRIADIPPQPATGHTICPECGCEWASASS
jgi:hypothetical protein